jgi:membrane protease YdiL (CAAX protease family)
MGGKGGAREGGKGESIPPRFAALPLIGPEPQTLAASSGSGPPAWKLLLALTCLALSALLWLDGLAGSLERPSVVDSLSLRQLELSALAAETLPAPLRPALVGTDPRGDLAKELQRQIEASDTPAPALQRLELALLKRSPAAGPATTPTAESATKEKDPLPALIETVEARRRPLLQALIEGSRVDPAQRRGLLAPWNAPAMVEQLSCEQLGGPAPSCPALADRFRLAVQLIGVNLMPALLALCGTGLLVREAWLQWRPRTMAGAPLLCPPLLGPPLTLVDVTLLIAGGFVLLGEVVVPLLAEPLLRGALKPLPLSEPLGQAVVVMALYLSLMVAPLTILWLMLRRVPKPAVGSWLQWYWRPLKSALRQAATMLLMVLPLVALAGWLIERLWGDPGGSNPLLELVLTSSDPLALALFAFTAVVLAPLFEETLFRGVLLPVVGEKFGGRWAVVISATVFAVAHLSLGELAPLFVLGIGLGWLRWRSGRLACCTLMHALWNGITFANLLLLAG